jgi:hypothetical protein
MPLIIVQYFGYYYTHQYIKNKGTISDTLIFNHLPFQNSFFVSRAFCAEVYRFPKPKPAEGRVQSLIPGFAVRRYIGFRSLSRPKAGFSLCFQGFLCGGISVSEA